MAQYSSSVLRYLWRRWQGQGSEYTGRLEPGGWADPLFMGKPIGGVPDVAADAFVALEAALTHTGYGPPDEGQSVWAYNYRPVAGTNVLSLHSYGIAIDIDPTHNPQSPGNPYSGWLDPEHVDAVLGIRTTSGKTAWSWGGYWSVPDRMHFQLDVGPDDTAIDWATVPGWEEPDMPLSDEDIERIAAAVWGHKIDTVEGKNPKPQTAKFLLQRGYLIVRQYLGGFSGEEAPSPTMLQRIDDNTKP